MIFLPNLLILLDVTGRFAIILFRNSLDWRAHMKKRSLLKNVCRNLVDSLTSHTKISEDQVFKFMEELTMEEPKALSEMPPDYRRLVFPWERYGSIRNGSHYRQNRHSSMAGFGEAVKLLT